MIINVQDTDIVLRGTCNSFDGLYNIPIQKTILQDNHYVALTLKGLPMKPNNTQSKKVSFASLASTSKLHL